MFIKRNNIFSDLVFILVEKIKVLQEIKCVFIHEYKICKIYSGLSRDKQIIYQAHYVEYEYKNCDYSRRSQSS